MSLALSLHAAGLTDVEVFESASSPRDGGVGIDVHPPAVRELAELGLLPELEPLATPTAELVMYSRHGRRVLAERRGRAAGYRWSQLSIHRGHLLRVLHRTVVDRLGADRIHHGHHLARAGSDGDHAVAMFVDRPSGAPLAEIQADVLVGCDGVHSAVRSALFPRERAPLWNGVTSWRGIAEAPPFLSGQAVVMAGHADRRLVVSPLTTTARGDRVLVNWVAEHRTASGRPMPSQDWDRTVDIDEVLATFGDFHLDFIDFPALVRASEAVFQYPVVDRDPLDRWTHGRVTLLGDAAHPMYPVGSNGASQAIVDGRVLARHLALAESVDGALAAYEAERLPATSKMVRATREHGLARCLELVEQRAPDGFERLEDVFALGELERLAEDAKAVAGFAVHTLNHRPSLSVHQPVA